jgi:hypothetical protein
MDEDLDIPISKKRTKTYSEFFSMLTSNVQFDRFKIIRLVIKHKKDFSEEKNYIYIYIYTIIVSLRHCLRIFQMCLFRLILLNKHQNL